MKVFEIWCCYTLELNQWHKFFSTDGLLFQSVESILDHLKQRAEKDGQLIFSVPWGEKEYIAYWYRLAHPSDRVYFKAVEKEVI